MIVPKEQDLKPCNMLAKRLVENQQRSATLKLVGGDKDKHDELEAMLEASKPPIESSLDQRHFLIKTPFRYPPLRNGSRFGKHTEKGIFYASSNLECLFAEVAYYRFVFLDDMEAPFKEWITTEHTVFDIRIKSETMLSLDEAPFDEYTELWIDPINYAACKALGAQARAIGAEVIRYYSARALKQIRNYAVFDHNAIEGEPVNLQGIRCTLNASKCIFVNVQNNEMWTGIIDDFLHEGVLPRPSD